MIRYFFVLHLEFFPARLQLLSCWRESALWLRDPEGSVRIRRPLQRVAAYLIRPFHFQVSLGQYIKVAMGRLDITCSASFRFIGEPKKGQQENQDRDNFQFVTGKREKRED